MTQYQKSRLSRRQELERLRASNAELVAQLTNLVECLETAERHDDLPVIFAGYGRDHITRARAALSNATDQDRSSTAEGK
jgi:hypothetical protein